nr:hypothetical protein [Tanacetum cinerariifolium]
MEEKEEDGSIGVDINENGGIQENELQNADKYKEEARSVLLNTKENVNLQEKRPALVQKRAMFSMKPNGRTIQDAEMFEQLVAHLHLSHTLEVEVPPSDK